MQLGLPGTLRVLNLRDYPALLQALGWPTCPELWSRWQDVMEGGSGNTGSSRQCEIETPGCVVSRQGAVAPAMGEGRG